MNYIPSVWQAWVANRRAQPLGYRVLLYTLLWSALVTSLAITLQMFLAYRVELASLQTRLLDIERAYIPSLSASVWAVDRPNTALMLDSIARLPDIHSLKLSSTDDPVVERAVKGAGDVLLSRSYALTQVLDKPYAIGDLEVRIGAAGVFQRLRQRAFGIALMQFVTIFLVSLFVFGLVRRMIAERLEIMADFARNLDLSKLNVPLVLPGQASAVFDAAKPSSQSRDEITQVAEALNRMRARLLVDIDERDAFQRELAQHRDHLEELVAVRTHALEQQSLELRTARDQAEATLARLRKAQQQLVESEKMASLGQLVAGVAHEVNTPIGIALTAGSFMAGQSHDLAQQLNAGSLSKSALSGFAHECEEASGMIVRHLERAAKLVQNFKQVSVDRSSDGRRLFELDSFLTGLIDSLQSLWKTRPVQVKINCAAHLAMDSFPGALGTVLTSLIQNALLHAFSLAQAGTIRIDIQALPDADSQATQPGHAQIDKFVLITVIDDGAGISAEHQAKIFEPFFTTSRASGAIGLGLHVAYNLVSQKLGGTIAVQSSELGTLFRLILPMRAPGE